MSEQEVARMYGHETRAMHTTIYIVCSTADFLYICICFMGPIRKNIQLPFRGNQANLEARVTISES